MKTFFAGLAVLAFGTSHAVVAYTSFGPSDSFTNSGWTIGDTSSANQSVGSQFVSTATGQITQARFAIFDAGADPGELVTVTLWSDSGSDTLGSILASSQVDPIPDGVNGIVTVASDFDAASLVSGNKYWVTMQAAGGYTYAWNINNQLIVTPFGFSADGSTNYSYFPGDTGTMDFDVVPSR